MKIRLCSIMGVTAVMLFAMGTNRLSPPIGPVPALAAEQAQPVPIEITADNLVTDNQKRTAIFKGNVTVVQAETKLTADQLTIIYKDGKASQATDTSDIERLEAQGNVRIEFDNKLAVSNQAVYNIVERKLVLEGAGSKVISDKDQVTGTRITFYRNDGRMILEGDGQERVKAVIHSDQRGLN